MCFCWFVAWYKCLYSVAVRGVLYHCLATNHYLAKRMSSQHSNTDSYINTRTRRLFTSSSQGTNLRVGTILFFTFDKRMKDGAARHFGVVITNADGYSSKLEKQVRRISIAFTLWFTSPNNSFHLIRRRRLWCSWWPTGSLWLFAFSLVTSVPGHSENLPLLLAR
jgi:hypothetical protein